METRPMLDLLADGSIVGDARANRGTSQFVNVGPTDPFDRGTVHFVGGPLRIL
jgi:hypothetical protein